MIELTDQIAIKADRLCFTICFPKRRKGKRSWEAEFYYADPEHLFRKLALLALAQGIEEGSWEAVARRLDEIQTVIEENLSRILSILPGYAKGGAGGEAQSEKAYPSMGESLSPPYPPSCASNIEMPEKGLSDETGTYRYPTKIPNQHGQVNFNPG